MNHSTEGFGAQRRKHFYDLNALNRAGEKFAYFGDRSAAHAFSIAVVVLVHDFSSVCDIAMLVVSLFKSA